MPGLTESRKSRRTGTARCVGAFAGFAAACCFAGCTAPFEVRKVEPGIPVEGIRYELYKPVFSGALRFNPAHGSRAESFDLVISQKMVPAETYEIIPKARVLADTEFSAEIDANGKLKNLTSGETDRTKDFIVSVAKLALAAGFAPQGESATDDFRDYKAKHAKLVETHRRSADRLAALESEGLPDDPADIVTYSEALAKGKAVVDALDRRVKADVYPLSPETLRIIVDGVPVFGADAPNPWVVVTFDAKS